jgi:uncharacterized protein YegP (UPF0339 family)
MQIILKKSDAAEPFTFAFQDSGGKTIVRSENYKAKSSALNGIESVRKNAINDARYEMKESTNGKFYFNLKSSNGQIVATSAMFDDMGKRDSCIAELKNQAPDAGVDDQT